MIFLPDAILPARTKRAHHEQEERIGSGRPVCEKSLRHLAGLKGVVSELSSCGKGLRNLLVWGRRRGGWGGGHSGRSRQVRIASRGRQAQLRQRLRAAFRFHEDDCSAEISGIDGMGSFPRSTSGAPRRSQVRASARFSPASTRTQRRRTRLSSRARGVRYFDDELLSD